MKLNSVVAPTQNYLESEDLIFEIGDEEVETKKKRDDDHAGYGHEDIESEEGEVEVEDDSLDEFDDFDWGEDDEVLE